MGMFGDLVGSLVDMEKLSKLQKSLDSEISALKASGKCPDDLAKAADFIKNFKGDGSATDAAKSLESFIGVLQKHSDLFSDELKNNLPKMLSVVEDLQKKAADVEKLTKK